MNNPFNRNLLILLILLYVLTLAAFSYANWAADPEFMEWWKTLLNIPILSIPLLLVFGSIYVLVLCWRQHSTLKQVDPRLAKIVHWAPRIAAILIILFTGLFSLDVFESKAPPLELLAGFLLHNLPAIVMLVLLAIAWKRPVVGFVAFLAAAAAFAFFFVRDLYALPNLLLFVLPILLIAALYYADWQWLRPQPSKPVEAAN
jgi:uncharacterized membrane protein YidH (DUF202 family)